MVESLESKLSQAEEHLKRQENLMFTLQQEIILQDQMWEKKQLMWEQIQVCKNYFLFVCRLLWFEFSHTTHLYFIHLYLRSSLAIFQQHPLVLFRLCWMLKMANGQNSRNITW